MRQKGGDIQIAGCGFIAYLDAKNASQLQKHLNVLSNFCKNIVVSVNIKAIIIGKKEKSDIILFNWKGTRSAEILQISRAGF